jgi:hypothetical protein
MRTQNTNTETKGLRMTDKSGRGGKRKGAGRKPKADEKREQKSVNLTPSVWAFIAGMQEYIGGSENDALEYICRTHPHFPAPRE